MKALDPKYVRIFKEELKHRYPKIKDLSSLNERTEDEWLLFLYAYYDIFNTDLSDGIDLINGSVYDIKKTFKITGLYTSTDTTATTTEFQSVEENDQNGIDVILVFSPKKDMSFPDILNEICSLASTGETFITQDIRGQATGRQHPIFNRLHALNYSSDTQFTIKIVTDLILTQKEKNKVLKAIKDKKIEARVIFGDEVEYVIEEIENPRENVETSVVAIEDSSHIVVHEKSIITNISALSIQTLYQNHGYRGLFSQNLRYYVRKANVDDAIVNTILTAPQRFWYYNNGLIIVCKKYEFLPSNQIKLYNFSIVNGGQTTKQIGETEFGKDFYVPCKIVCCEGMNDDDYLDFVSSVAEASNTQKPINATDLIANKPEQRALKKQLNEAGIFCLVKRGEKMNKKLYPQRWQRTSNVEIAQLLLSFLYQCPGVARNNKDKVISNKQRYAQIFGVEYDSLFLKDLLRIPWVFAECWDPSGETQDYMTLSKNALMFITATIGLLFKLYTHNDEILSQLNTAQSTQQQKSICSYSDINHKIFNAKTNDEFEIKIRKLFKFVMRKFIYPGCAEYLKDTPNGNTSNFTKTDKQYETKVLNGITAYYSNGVPEEDMELLNDVFYSATMHDRNKDHQLRAAGEGNRPSPKESQTTVEDDNYIAFESSINEAFENLGIPSSGMKTILKALVKTKPTTASGVKKCRLNENFIKKRLEKAKRTLTPEEQNELLKKVIQIVLTTIKSIYA